MSDTYDLLRALSELAYRLYTLNMTQAAADYDYLVDWMKSPSFNNGVHLPPHPAGKNTKDEYSSNCPIPYYTTEDVAPGCLNVVEAVDALNGIKSILAKLKSGTEDSIEVTAIEAYETYTDDLIMVLTGEEHTHTVDFNESISMDSNSRIDKIYSDGKLLTYDFTKSYRVTKYLNASTGEWEDNYTTNPDGEIVGPLYLTLDRDYKSGAKEAGNLALKNVSSGELSISSFEYEVVNSGRLQACFSTNELRDDSQIKLSMTIQPGEYAIVCSPVYDEEDEDDSVAIVVEYEEYTSYTGVRYRDGNSGAFNSEKFDNKSLVLGKEYIPARDMYALAIHNTSNASIKIKDFEYEKKAIQVLTIVAPDEVVGDGCSIDAMYNGNIVNPSWSLSPEGPTITNGKLSFSDSDNGEYTLSASYSGLTVEKKIKLEYKQGWKTKTTIDESGDYPIANTTITDDSGNQESETIIYIDGEPMNIGFDIIPGNEDVPVVIDEGKDTKIYTFNGTNGFELFFKFHYDPSLQPPPDYADKPGETDTNKHFTLLNMKYEVPPYPGIVFRHNENASKMQISITPMNPIDPAHPTATVEVNLTHDGIPDIYMHDFYMRYEPSAPFEKFVIVDNTLGTGDVKTRADYYTYEFSNEVTATLGYVNAGTIEEPMPCRQCLFDVYDFRLNKIINPWKEVPITIETYNVGDLLVTKEYTADDDHLVKRMCIEPDPSRTTDEYVYLDEPLVFNDIKPFIDKDQVFELEYDIMIDYEDQTFASNDNFVVPINAISEPTDWPGLCVRLSKSMRPDERFPNGRCDHRLRYTTDRNKREYLLAHSSERVDGVFYDGYVIDDDHIIHYRYIYEGTAASLCSALYSYKTNRYLIFTNLKNLYAVVPHNFPLCIGCAVDANLQKIRICRMKIKKIEYVQKIRG